MTYPEHKPQDNDREPWPRTRTRRRLTLRGWLYKAECVCGHSMRFYMDRGNRDIWAGHHESKKWCAGRGRYD